jgi:DNA-directed RNA polymerase specialized sigma subunit
MKLQGEMKMYNNFNSFNQDQYLRGLQNLKNEAEQRINQFMQYQNVPPQQPAINQTFQLSPNQNNSEFDGKTVSSVEDVRNTLTLKTTFFITTDRKTMWIKDASGLIKTYTLEEVIELDEKDKQILELKKQIEELKGAGENGKNDNKYATREFTKSKSTSIQPSNAGNE